MNGHFFQKPSVIELGNGGRRIDVPQLVENFLSKSKVVRFHNDLFLFDVQTGLWIKKSKEEIKRLASQTLQKEDLTLWTVKTSQNVMEQLDIRIPNLNFDEKKHKNLLALDNCIVNLYTGKTANLSPKYFFTSKSHFSYHLEAECPIFKNYLETVCEGDSKMILMLEELLGYLLTNQTKIQNIFYLFGTGKNGKSVFLDVVRELVGEGNFVTLTPQQLESSFSRTALENKKVLLIGDMNKRDSSNFITAEIKKLSGGDMISAEKKYGSTYQFKPFVKVVVSSNFFPVSSNDPTFGAMRRIFLVPFQHQITDSEEDISLMDKLKEELPGILNLAMAGLRRLIKNNYTFSYDGSKAWKGIMAKEHPVKFFVDEMILPQPNGFVKYLEIQKSFKEWCQKKKINCREPSSMQIKREISQTFPHAEPWKRGGDRGMKNICLKKKEINSEMRGFRKE